MQTSAHRPVQSADCPVQPSAQFLLYILFIDIAVIVTMTTILIIIIVMTMTTTIVTMHILEAMITAIYGIVVGRRWPRGNIPRHDNDLLLYIIFTHLYFKTKTNRTRADMYILPQNS